MSKLSVEDIKGFFFDSIGVTIAFFINSFLIILFYHLTTNGVAEIVYPMIISFTVYAIYMFFKGVNYFRFIKSLKVVDRTLDFNEYEGCYEKKMVYNALDMQFKRSMKEIADLNLRMKNFKSFFSQWIHDMKTPVSVIELVLQNDYEDIGDFKKEIKEENIRLLDNLEKALGFIRLEDFSKDYLVEEVNLREEIFKVINRKKREFIYNRISPKIICEDENVSVLTDIKWNQFVIEQITNNAIKYSKEMNCIKNIYYIISKEHDKVRLIIKDEGMGISDQDIKRIFEPFFTGENGRRVSGSSGVGLYIVKQVCEKLNEKIEVKSEVKNGSEFKITYRTQEFK